MTRHAPFASVVLVASALTVTPACSSSSSSGSTVVAEAGTDAASARACTSTEIAHADGTCGPADWAVACADGFAPDPSGFGCRDVLPDAPCVGATRGALGQTTCAPVGDCGAAFPPTNATLFVAAAGPSDATHFTTIGAAIAAASAGAVIAVDSGTYGENVDITKPISIVGKCPAEVVIDGAKTTGARGVYVDGTTGVAVSGVTITHQTLGVSIAPNSAVGLKHVVLEDNRDVGLALQQGSAKATLEDVVIRGTKEGAEPGFGINAQSGSEITMSDTELVGNQSTAVRVSSSSKATITKSVIRDTAPSKLEAYGRGLVVQTGGSADISTTAFIGNEEVALVLNACTVKLSQVVVRDTLPTPSGDFGRAIDAFDGGNFTADSCSFTSNRDVSIIAVNASATITRSAIQATMPDGNGAFGRGIVLQEAAKLVLSGTAIVGASDAGI
ncbi:MAG: right-handed parallel beta-helix repeat-containing protein, partial [Polyangiaceae bacterium]